MIVQYYCCTTAAVSHRQPFDEIEDKPSRGVVGESPLRREHEAQHVHDDQQHRHGFQQHAGLVVGLQEVIQPTAESRRGLHIA